MAFATSRAEASKGGFRLSMLIYDTRFRAITLQVVALILFLLFIGWLTDNVIRNLDAKGKDINFGFLWVRAGYDIEQTLIPYTNDDNHGRAVIIGLLNTLVVAFFGCILATVVGVIVGVLRLSNNWLISRLMTIYVEIFRNVPLLLWILLVFVVISETMPAPADFKITPAILESRAALAGLEAQAGGNGLWMRIATLKLGSLPFILWLLAFIGITVAAWQFASARFQGAKAALIAAIPALIWVIMALTVFSPSLSGGPAADAQLAEIGATEPAASKFFFDSIAVTNRGTNIPAPLLDRPLGGTEFAGVPVNFSVLAVIAVLIVSLLANRAVVKRAKSIQESTGNRPTTWYISLVILFLPLILLLLALGLHWEVPGFPVNDQGVSTGFNLRGGIQVMHSFTALLIALALYTSAFIAEIVRAGIQAIPRGQSEAAAALGLRPGRTMRLVVLPQALRVIIPPLISQYLNLTKNTSLGIAVSYLDLRGTLGGITLNQTGRELEAMLLMMLIYLTISLIISMGMNAFNAAVKLKER
ncbi:ABC transporter permease subunit [Xinfangfangia sp. D13-10-4-6]|uniref:amino acid ABC transporter permease n=1 Tax=Pseudogemmobacter hezensis TaxID=2737662 RepID=UPI0015576AF5|nr:ABC transporter permease subunit [Pseudogemmobacter hezensis]NPD17676.1 ABC transporter permease subunit [Pseudogemmobacter hezensis]